MIDELRARDVALIRDATIRPADGLTALTGETGTGKTALLSALKLLVGERADAAAVREGAEGLCVEGRVFLPGEPDGTIVRRRVSADGRGRVELDGRMASVRELAERVGSTVDLCGQHEHQILLGAQSHVRILDAWTGEAAERACRDYASALSEARKAAAELARVRELSRSASERLEQARFELARIDEVGPAAGELEDLERELPVAEHAEALVNAAEESHEALTGDDGIEDRLSRAVEVLRQASAYDETLGERADALESALVEVEDVALGLGRYRDSVDLDEGSLARMQERMAALQGLMRSYGPSMRDVLERRAAAAELVEAASGTGEREREATTALEAAERRLATAADALDAVRREAAPRFSEAVVAQMRRLQMGTAELVVAIERLDRRGWTESGPSRVEFLYRPASGLTPRPLRRIASGGEVSRVMLACKVALGEADDVGTLVFDEVDAGVGGTTAVALAAVLADLATTHQVIVVTHLAQVAVAAERHYVVAKSEGDVVETTIREVTGDERTAEIARMLSGDATEASLAHAAEMLASAAS